MTLEPLLRRAAQSLAEDLHSHRPRVLNPFRQDERSELAELLETGQVVSLHDTFDEQVRDLLASREPSQRLSREALEARVAAWLEGRPSSEAGRWIYYPWSRRLIHLLSPEDYRELRTDRNRYKLTPLEQESLRQRRIAVAGLSVGLASALTLAQEGVGGAFHLADFDTLGVSNLNRLRAGVEGLGLKKTVLAARLLFEMDPYLDVTLFSEGVTEDNLDAFLGLTPGGPRVDLLVEECDDLKMKLRLRERARAARLPVLMESSDRGMLDIERFDLEPERALLHGRVGAVGSKQLQGYSPREKLPVVLRILDEQQISPRMAASVMEVGETLSTWPQLASGVALGGAVATDAARRILLGKLTCSGRFYVDLEELVRAGAEAKPSEPVELRPAPEALEPRAVPVRPPPRRTGPLTAEEFRFLVGCGVLAHSFENSQPWRFHSEKSTLRCALDLERARGLSEAEACAALGGAVENILQAAGTLGLGAHVAPVASPNAQREWRITFARGAPMSAPDGLALLAERVTGMRAESRVPLTPEESAWLHSPLDLPGVRWEVVEDEVRLARLGELLGAADRLRLTSEDGHRATMLGLRWTAEEVRSRRDGIDVSTLLLDATDAALLQLQARWPVMAAVAEMGVGRGLSRPAQADFAKAAAAALLVTEGVDPEAGFHAGRALQRLWLGATARKRSVRPYRLPELLAAPEAHGSPDSAAWAALRSEYQALFKLPEGSNGMVVLRLGHGGPPQARSLRRPVDEVLHLG